MAKLIISRPRTHWLESASPTQEILIRVDGEPAGSITVGEKTELELPPGRHRVRAGSNLFGSQPVDIQVTADAPLRLAVGLGSGWRKWMYGSVILVVLSVLPQLGFTLWDMHRGPQGSVLVAFRGGWLSLLQHASMILPVVGLLLQLLVVVTLRNHSLDLVEVPSRDLTDDQIVELMRSQPFRVRIKIGQLMSAVALVAGLLAGGIAWTRHARANQFRGEATIHASLEELFRESEQNSLSVAVDLEKRGLNASVLRQSAVRYGARADYHAALRRKYEDAAAHGRFSVESDPPAPP